MLYLFAHVPDSTHTLLHTCSAVLCPRVPLKVIEDPIQNVKNLAGIRQRLQLRYNGGAPGDAPEPLTNYLDVSQRKAKLDAGACTYVCFLFEDDGTGMHGTQSYVKLRVLVIIWNIN